MSSDYIKFRTSLVRRFQTISSDFSPNLNDTAKRASNRSFAMRYLLSFTDEAHEDLSVLVMKAALDVAHRDGRTQAMELANRFLSGAELEVARGVIVGDHTHALTEKMKLPDKFLFGFPTSFNLGPTEMRNCYNETLSDLGIRTPLNKRGMLQLVKAIEPTYVGNKVNTFDQLSDFIWKFVRSSWPLFDASILHIPLTYFSFRENMSSARIRDDLKLMKAYGLERLLGRLIVLHAVCGNKSARNAVLDGIVLNKCEYRDPDISRLSSFIDEGKAQIEIGDLQRLGRGNPIQRATHLVMFINQIQEPFSFLEGLIEVYCIDPSVLKLIDWEPMMTIIEETSEYYTPELIAMASIFSSEGMLDNSPRLKDLYVPTSANTDLFNYAVHCREQLNMSPHQFFASFSKLPTNVQAEVFRFLLYPGTMDTIANVFPSGKNVLSHVNKSYSVNALGMKLDCISYLKKRGLLKKNYIQPLEESTRQRLRQVKYESETSDGRIRVNEKKISGSLMDLIEEQYFGAPTHLSLFREDLTHLRAFLLNIRDQQFSQLVADHICFKSRFAFDYLLSNLRHNFLRYKLESAIDSAFHSYTDPQISMFKSALQNTLDDFFRNWLTICKTRSFYNGLADSTLNLLVQIRGDEEPNAKQLASDIGVLAKSRFDSLLEDCRRVWTTEVQSEVVELVIHELSVSKYASDTGLHDELTGALESAFDDAEGWLTVNDNPISNEFGIRELFVFESTNFSSAKTRVKPLNVGCYRVPYGGNHKVRISGDVMIAGSLFDAMVQLVHNLLENAFDYSGLPIADTSISVEITEYEESDLEIEFRNNFDPDKKSEMPALLDLFNQKVEEARHSVLNAPIDVGGSGIRRIYFECYSAFGTDFSLKAENSEFGSDTFLVRCKLPYKRDVSNG